MNSVEKTVEYRFDSKIYSSEDVRRKIEEIKKSFNKISNKPIEVRMELDEFGIYVVVFKFYAKGKYVKPKKEKKISRIHIESLTEKSNGYINNLMESKDAKYIKKMKDKSKETKELQKRLKESQKKAKQAEIEYVKEQEDKKKIENKKKIEVQRLNDYQSKKKKKENKKEKKQDENVRKPHIEYLKREEDNRTFKEKITEYMQMLQNVKVPKLERKNKVKIKNRPEKPKIQYDKKQKKYGKKDNPVGEKHYWSDNYVPKEYGKYKQSNKKYKPL